MKIFSYLLTFVFGLYGVLGALRVLERLAVGESFLLTPSLLAVIMLALAWTFLRRARAAS